MNSERSIAELRYYYERTLEFIEDGSELKKVFPQLDIEKLTDRDYHVIAKCEYFRIKTGHLLNEHVSNDDLREHLDRDAEFAEFGEFYILFRTTLSEMKKKESGCGDFLYIINLELIDKRFAGQGYGKGLLSKVIDTLENAGTRVVL